VDTSPRDLMLHPLNRIRVSNDVRPNRREPLTERQPITNGCSTSTLPLLPNRARKPMRRHEQDVEVRSTPPLEFKLPDPPQRLSPCPLVTLTEGLQVFFDGLPIR